MLVGNQREETTGRCTDDPWELGIIRCFESRRIRWTDIASLSRVMYSSCQCGQRDTYVCGQMRQIDTLIAIVRETAKNLELHYVRLLEQ
jgi:hypothetical protein